MERSVIGTEYTAVRSAERNTQHPNTELFILTSTKMEGTLGGLSKSLITCFVHDKNGRHFAWNYEAQNTHKTHTHTLHYYKPIDMGCLF